MIKELETIVGAQNVVQEAKDLAGWSSDWTGAYRFTPLAVIRPGSREEVSAILKWANKTGTKVVPVSGNTGLSGGTNADGALLLSLDRMNKIRDLRPDARVAVVEAGVILANLHDAADAVDMIFPLTFGAKGSAMIGGCLSTNAGGSNVLRYGNTRDLVLGIEAVMPNGEIVDLMSELHKDNSGYNLKHLLIGAEGTLGIITAAVLKLHPKPRAYATAMVAPPSLEVALDLLNRLQQATGGAVEAFEYMPHKHIEVHKSLHPDARDPFDSPQAINILVEVGATAPRDCTIDDTGQTPLSHHLEATLSEMFEEGLLLDAVVAQNDAQRLEMWARREASAEIAMSRKPFVANDIAVPLDQVAPFLKQMEQRLPELDPEAEAIVVAHLGDGNVHYTVWQSSENAALRDQIMEAVEDVALALGGSFSAEHGIGLSKLPSMQRHKDPAAIAVMKTIKAALDPNNVLNPGKLLP